MNLKVPLFVTVEIILTLNRFPVDRTTGVCPLGLYMAIALTPNQLSLLESTVCFVPLDYSLYECSPACRCPLTQANEFGISLDRVLKPIGIEPNDPRGVVSRNSAYHGIQAYQDTRENLTTP
jgi:hypothetical protein